MATQQKGAVVMPANIQHIYQPSDLANAGRKPFIEDALRSEARLRTSDGQSLVMLPEARLEHVAAMRDYALAYLTLDTALSRPRDERRTSDYGPWAFIEAFDDDDIEDFQTEINDAIMRAASGQDGEGVERLLHQWRMSADTLSDPVARDILSDNTRDDDWLEVQDRDAPHSTATPQS